MKAIIFGINGQDGYYLSQLCKQKGIEVVGISRSGGEWIKGDVADFSFVENLIKSTHPDFVFHLAATSTTRHHALFQNHEAISTGTLNILEIVKTWAPACKVFLTGSGVQFVNTGNPIHESDPFEASSAYAVARIQSVFAARYFRSLGLKVYVGYLFHHESPFRKKGHLSKYIIDGVKMIRDGQLECLEIGDVSVKKEWAFAGDIVDGIWSLVSQEEVFEATIGSGKAYSVAEWLSCCFDLINLPWQSFVKSPNIGFKSEYPLLVSNPVTMNKLGWKTKMDIQDLAFMMYNH